MTSEVIKSPTSTDAGEKKYTAVFENSAFETQTKIEVIPASDFSPGDDPNQKGEDGTAVGPGASAACADKAITSMKSDNDPAGSKFAPLKLKSTKQFATSRPIPRSRPSQRRES